MFSAVEELELDPVTQLGNTQLYHLVGIATVGVPYDIRDRFHYSENNASCVLLFELALLTNPAYDGTHQGQVLRGAGKREFDAPRIVVGAHPVFR